MWKDSIRFVGRYFAIGVLIGVGIYAVDEIHWRLYGSERVAELQQSLDRLGESLTPDLGPVIARSKKERAADLASDETVNEPDLWRPTPYYSNGVLQGYRVYPGSDRRTFQLLGLRPGDLVTEIDGQPLNESEVAAELFGKAVSGQPVSFSILRGEGIEKIEIKVE